MRLVIGLAIAFIAGAACSNFVAPAGTTLFPAFSVLDEDKSTPAGLIARLGRGTKSAHNPLFGQTLDWEPRIDNGYANVAFDPQHSSQYPWRLWYDAFSSCNDDLRDNKMRYLHCGGGKRHHSGLYAESTDGISWVKPELDSGVTYLKGTGFCCDLHTCECKPGTKGAVKTNIYTMVANGNTVYLDQRPGVPLAEKYKVVGNNLPHNFEPAGKPTPDFGNQGGICASPDGLNFTDAGCTWLKIANSHWDSWSTLFWDEKSSDYLAPMRSSDDSYNPCKDRFYPSCMSNPAAGCDADACIHSTRDISRIQTNGSDWRSLGEVAGGSTPMLRSRDGGAQLYELVPFPYYGVYLAILDVYYAAGARQEVHCELAWSSDFKNWHRIEEGHDLIPLGGEGSFESHICYGSVPTADRSGAIREYYFGGDGPHFGTRNSSLALITFREGSLAGVGAPAHWHSPVAGQTKLLNISGAALLVTADTDTLLAGGENPQGSSTLTNVGKLTVSVAVDGLSKPIECSPLTGKNVTNSALTGCDLTAHVGKLATLHIAVDACALLYMVGFGPLPPPASSRR